MLRRSRTGTALGLLVLAIAACDSSGPDASGATSFPGDDARAEVLAELEAYYADFSARDWEAFSDHFWPGATITTVWRPPGEDADRVVVTSVPEFVERAPQGPGSREIFEERMTEAEVRVSGGLAQAWASYAARFGDPGEVTEWEGTDAFTHLEHDGRWRIVSLVFASDE